MAKRKKSSAKRRTPAATKRRTPTGTKRRSTRGATRGPKRKAREPKGRAPAGAVRALVAGKLPPPMYGVPRDQAGKTVQRFIDWDGVSELSVLEEALGTFQITPLA